MLLYQEAIDLATRAIGLSDNEHTRRLRARAYNLRAREYGGHAPEVYADAEKAIDDATKAIAFNNKNYRNYSSRIDAMEAWEENYGKQREEVDEAGDDKAVQDAMQASNNKYDKVMSTHTHDNARLMSLQPAN